MRGEIKVQGRTVKGRVSHYDRTRFELEMAGAIRDADVDDAITDMDLSQFHNDVKMRARLRAVLWDYREVFKGLGHIRGVTHSVLRTEGAQPVSCPVRRRSPREQDLEREAMEKLLRMGVFEHASSPWATCIVFVRKKDGSTRVTSDFRGLNAVTVSDSYPMEDVRATLDWMETKSVFSVFDLKDVFFQVELAEGSRDYTAIRTVIGLLRYMRLPQGLKHSPAVFQRTVNAILGGRKGLDVWAFMDDISLGTCDAEAHLESLRSVLETLLKAGARLKLSKCRFGVREVEVLGHRISPDGMRPSDIHVQAIRDLIMPQNGDDVMRFLGLANYFAQFVDHFADIARPLYAVLKGTGFNKRRNPGRRLVIRDWDNRWGPDQQRSWQ